MAKLWRLRLREAASTVIDAQLRVLRFYVRFPPLNAMPIFAHQYSAANRAYAPVIAVGGFLMRFVTLAAVLAGAVSLAGCLPLAQSPMSVSAGPQESRNLMYGNAEPVRAPAVSYARPREQAVAGTAAPVRSAEVATSRARRMTDAPAQSGGGADVVYSEKWYERERATEEKLTQTTKICRNC